MNITKFTQKSIEAIQNMEKIAYDYGNQMIDQEHFLYALLKQDDSLIAKLITKMGIQLPAFISSVEKIMEGDPKVQGGSPYVSQDLNNVLISAEDEAKAMGDDYVSVEHLMLSMIKHPNRSIKQLFKSFGIKYVCFISLANKAFCLKLVGELLNSLFVEVESRNLCACLCVSASHISAKYAACTGNYYYLTGKIYVKGKIDHF